MITIPRSLARRLRIVFSKALGVTPRCTAPKIQFHGDEHGLTIAIVGHDAAVAYRHSTPCAPASLAVPYQLLRQCEGNRDEPVTIACLADEIVASWVDAGIPQEARFPADECGPELPLPDRMLTNDPAELLTAIRDAVESTDREATRYALNCIRLRGSDGQIAGTDGRQLFVQHGFEFPWVGELIVPACRIFTCADIRTDEPVEIGCTDHWAVLRSGPWTIHLRIEKEGRFPAVDGVIPQPERIQSTLKLSGGDAAFLVKALRRMPANDHLNSPVTVELNGSVAIRAKGDDQPEPTELVLSGSRRDGVPLCFNTQRGYLSRAIRMSFRDVELSGAESPACCRQGRRAYVWGLLGKEGAIPSSPTAMRIESPAEGHAISGGIPLAKARGGVPKPHRSHTEPVHGYGAGADLAELGRGLEALQASLLETLSRTSALAESLRRQMNPVRSPDAIEAKAA